MVNKKIDDDQLLTAVEQNASYLSLKKNSFYTSYFFHQLLQAIKQALHSSNNVQGIESLQALLSSYLVLTESLSGEVQRQLFVQEDNALVLSILEKALKRIQDCLDPGLLFSLLIMGILLSCLI